MDFETAVKFAETGKLLTRAGYGNDFAAIRDGQVFRGHFVGETGFGETKAYVWSAEDRNALDWKFFSHILPDMWEGCDLPVR